jgi:hypothetical protein
MLHIDSVDNISKLPMFTTEMCEILSLYGIIIVEDLQNKSAKIGGIEELSSDQKKTITDAANFLKYGIDDAS